MNNKTWIKYFIIFNILLIPFLQLSARSLVEKAFVKMPDEYYLSLTTEMRSNMLDEYKKDTAYLQQNRFRGKSQILKLDSINDFISIQNSEKGKVDIKVLRDNTDFPIYIAVIFTACAPICDSHIGFYDAIWQFLPNSLLPTISINDFLDVDKIKNEGKKSEDIADQIGMAFVQYSFVGNNIEIMLQAEKSLEADNYKRLKPYFKKEKLTFVWKNGGYEPEI